MKNSLLVELACEELPPKALKTLGESLHNFVVEEFKNQRFGFQSSHWFATPRRLALYFTELQNKQTDIEVVKKGPPVKSAYDQSGQPTKAALGWAKSNNITLEQASIVETPKGQWLQITVNELGKNIDSCLETIMQSALAKLPIPKLMRWGNSDHQFVRPVHNLCCLYGESVLPISIMGHKANAQVLGHRFHSPGLHTLTHADNYEELLDSLNVVADFEKRKYLIQKQLAEEANKVGAVTVEDAELVEEVTSLVEYPVVLKATFDESFLEVPKEPLIYTMKDDQRYFPLLAENSGELLNQFLFVTNIQSKNPDSVVSGNEKVVRPRLADAQFFYKHDLSVDIQTRLDSLKTIVYQKQLGTLYDKSERVAKLSQALSELFALGDPKTAYRAGLLAKSDLTSKVVYEFPDVQGYMGRYYALNEGESPEVADAIAQHYMPRSSGDALPSSPVSQVVSIAERLDTLVGIFGIGLLPKGDKDPFALRRATLGIIKVVLDNDITFDLAQCLKLASELFAQGTLTNKEWPQQISQFFTARTENFFVEQGAAVTTVRAAMESSNNHITSLKYKVEALTNFIESDTDTISELTESNKRIANILAKNPVSSSAQVNTTLFSQAEEHTLWEALQSIIGNSSTNNLSIELYSDMLAKLSSLKQPISQFFDKVMVNAEEESIRNNRLTLLATIRKEFLEVADVSLLQL